jgi:xanthine dehydrogenase accessory factor
VIEVWRALVGASERGERVALATVVGVDGSAPRQGGARMVVWPDGHIVGTIGGGALEHRAIAEARAAIATGAPRRLTVHLTRDLGMCCGGAMDVLIEPLSPIERLVIYGGGHVGRATAQVARVAGFDVTVVDDRDEWSDPADFPGVTVRCESPLAHARALGADERTWLLLTTHAHSLDQDLLSFLLPGAWAWLGLIGSRSKAAKFFLRLKAGGVEERLFSRVSVPVGLDLGAETPGEIAVSVVAEMIQVRRGGTGHPLADAPLPARGAPYAPPRRPR